MDKKGTTAGKMEDRKEEREGGREKGTKEECNMWRREQLMYPFNRGGEKRRNQLLTEDCTSQ
jgi:hypothetical protein